MPKVGVARTSRAGDPCGCPAGPAADKNHRVGDVGAGGVDDHSGEGDTALHGDRHVGHHVSEDLDNAVPHAPIRRDRGAAGAQSLDQYLALRIGLETPLRPVRTVAPHFPHEDTDTRNSRIIRSVDNADAQCTGPCRRSQIAIVHSG